MILLPVIISPLYLLKYGYVISDTVLPVSLVSIPFNTVPKLIVPNTLVNLTLSDSYVFIYP